MTARPSTRRKPVGLGYMPKGGAPAAQRVNDQWREDVAAGQRDGDLRTDGRARESAIRSGWPVGVACWSVVAASCGALVTEASILWVVFL